MDEIFQKFKERRSRVYVAYEERSRLMNESDHVHMQRSGEQHTFVESAVTSVSFVTATTRRRTAKYCSENRARLRLNAAGTRVVTVLGQRKRKWDGALGDAHHNARVTHVCKCKHLQVSIVVTCTCGDVVCA